MAPVVPNPKSIRSFRSGRAFETWLSTNQASGRGTTFAEIREGHIKADTPEPAPGDVRPAKEEGWFLIGAGIPLLPAGSETTLVLADQMTLPSGIVALAYSVPGGVGPPPRIGYVTSGGKRAKAGNARKSTASRRAGRAS
jgi:hypothetical protein